nr:sugar ABC transporter permease [Clostridia bacterium]
GGGRCCRCGSGCCRFQRIRYVALPGIVPIVALMLLLRVGNILQAGYEQILIMYNPAVYSVADILQTYIYRIGLGKLDFSTGTAMGMFESVVGFMMVITCNGISRKCFGRSLW